MIKEIGQLIRDYTNQQIDIVVSGKTPKETLTAEGQAKKIKKFEEVGE